MNRVRIDNAAVRWAGLRIPRCGSNRGIRRALEAKTGEVIIGQGVPGEPYLFVEPAYSGRTQPFFIVPIDVTILNNCKDHILANLPFLLAVFLILETPGCKGLRDSAQQDSTCEQMSSQSVLLICEGLIVFISLKAGSWIT